MDDLSDLISISRFAGERFDLVQAGGGNTSQRVGIDDLYVKASGLALSAVSAQEDFCCVKFPQLVDFLDRASAEIDMETLNGSANQAVAAAMQPSKRRPSIETLLHCVLGPLTLHTHPIAVTSFACRLDWQAQLSQRFADAVLVDYKTPGLPLALSLRQKLKERDWQAGDPVIVFLQNHGLIVSARTKSQIIELTNSTVSRLSDELNPQLKKYSLVNFTSGVVNKVCSSRFVSYLSDDQYFVSDTAHGSTLNHHALLEKILSSAPLTPDQLVYGGPLGLTIDADNIDGSELAVARYFTAHKQPPRMLYVKSGGVKHLIFLAASLQKCKDTEDVLKSILLMQITGNSDATASELQHLSPEEVAYLSNWEAEKYRQSL